MKKRFCSAIIILFLIFISISCNKVTGIKRLQELEEGVSNPNTEAELKEAIRKYEKRVDDIIIAEGRIGIWYKILGSRYMDQKMYEKALKAFQSALEYYPENQNLFYQTGLAASLTAKNSLDFELTGTDIEKQRYFSLAVSAYNRALEIDPKHSKAVYALSVLYIFELNRPADAIPILERVTESEKKPIDHLFLLGAAYSMTGESEKAVSVYERIIEVSSSAENKAKAESNIREIKAGGR
ncbi:MULTISPECIES: lipopolysaccharide assembly protein LapB [unclassified Treponema]|uniref:tetratricopeptide repeat protein n=1 Tax=unclassified Treponema TaxID=2638727 RepID=UPI0020A55DDF|nr:MULTISPECIES: tetratricopeptide repeat protein [unclassified Treponema]UTC65883.1 tetratricopeptide repeat protein [Treponema sp. OMZ 789]UTC68611.1 tetratricopeptide repeat protein [Treponema sp. OMZ 790]UTC71341.1 tetratricopeptide repeat protein [Treponema sp. OMZ 791]